MPLNAVPAAFYIGQLPPNNPSAFTIWRSTSLADMRVPTDLRDRPAILTANTLSSGSNREDKAILEPNAYYDAASGTWNLLYTAAGFTSSRLALAQSSNGPRGPWTRYGVVLGQGTGGEAGTVQHAGVYVESGTLYLTYDIGTGNLRFTTATIQTSGRPGSFAAPSTIASNPTGSANFGNSQIFKRGTNDYLLLCDFSLTGITWQFGYYTSTSPSGPWTLAVLETKGVTYYSNPAGGPPADQGGNLFVVNEGSRYIAFCHLGPRNSGGANISDGFRAVTSDSTLTGFWTMDSVPLIRRSQVQECDQLADLMIAQGPNDVWWIFWDGVNNPAQTAAIYAAPLIPVDKMYDGYNWNVVGINTDRGLVEDWNLQPTQVASYTASHKDDVAVDTNLGSFTVTLPYATFGTRVRVMNAGPNNGANVVTIAFSGSDVLINGGSVMPVGIQRTFRCYYPGRWSQS